MRSALFVIVLTGCGRISFDAIEVDASAPGDPSLIAWYPLDDAFGVDAFARDHSGNSRHAPCGSCPSQTAGRNGGLAAHFDGASDHLVIAHEPVLDFATGFTLALWVNPEELPTTSPDSLINRPYGPASENAYGIDMKTVTGMTVFEFGTVGDELRSVTLAMPDTWFHVAATWDGAVKRVYLHGALDQQTPRATVPYDIHDVVIGADTNSGTTASYFRGRMFDVRIYDRALSDAEIADLSD